MTTPNLTAPRPRLDLGRVFADSGRAASGARWALLVLFVVDLAPLLVWAAFPWRATGQTRLERWAEGFGVAVGFGAVALLAHAATAWVVVQVVASRPISLRAALGRALTALPLLLAADVVQRWPSVARLLIFSKHLAPASVMNVYFALAFAELPFLLVWAVCLGILTPVAALEGPSLPGSLVRTFSLMRGGRWQFLLASLAEGVLGTGRDLLYRMMVRTVGADPVQRFIVRAVNDLASCAVALVFAVFTAAFYLELCRLHDGVAPGEVAGVFD